MSDTPTLDPGTRRMLWRFAPMIYGPTMLFSIGEGALLPLLPVIAANRGASVPQAALVASALVVAQLIGNLPAGWAVARIGERWTMGIAATVALVGVVGVIGAPNLAGLALALFVIGLCAAAFGLARHAFMATRVPLGYRARALSVLGGSFRLGLFIGPFLAAGLLSVVDDEASVACLFAGCLVALIVLVMFGRDPEESQIIERHPTAHRTPDTPRSAAADESGQSASEPSSAPERSGVFRTMWRHRGVLAGIGLSAASLSGIRQARVYVLPLWGVSIGLDAQSIVLIVGIAGAVEFALFYASGQIMDRWGRLWAALPSMLLMSGAFIGLSATHDLDAATAWFIAAAVVIGIGNGLSSGILMTLGADLAPRGDPAPFLGSWRTLTDAGGAAAPLLVSAIAAAVSLSLAAGVIGVLGLFGAVGFAVFVPRHIPRACADS